MDMFSQPICNCGLPLRESRAPHCGVVGFEPKCAVHYGDNSRLNMTYGVTPSGSMMELVDCMPSTNLLAPYYATNDMPRISLYHAYM